MYLIASLIPQKLPDFPENLETIIRSIGKEGVEYGHFRGPVGIDVDDSRGDIAISDFENHRVQVTCCECFSNKKYVSYPSKVFT